jgi:hypothetical protein
LRLVSKDIENHNEKDYARKSQERPDCLKSVEFLVYMFCS